MNFALKSIFLSLILRAFAVDGVCYQDTSLEDHARVSSRSVVIYIHNRTKCLLKLIMQDLKYGVWTREPARNIQPGKCRSWATQSEGFLTGTEAGVDYKCFDTDTIFHLTWDNPFVGKISVDYEFPAYVISRSGGAGDNAVVDFELSEQ